MPPAVLEYLVDLLVTERAVRRARVKSRSGNHDGAIYDLKALIAAKGATPQRLASLAWILINAGQNEKALEVSDRLMAMDPKNTWFMSIRARALRRLGRFPEALALMEARFNDAKSDAYNASELCKLLIDLGRGDEAIGVFREIEKRYGGVVIKPGEKKSGAMRAYLQARDRLRQSGRRV